MGDSKSNILQGMPVLFTTRVIDDTKGQRFGEKNRRFINVTPDVSDKKIKEAMRITMLKSGSLPEYYDEAVVSRKIKQEK